MTDPKTLLKIFSTVLATTFISSLTFFFFELFKKVLISKAKIAQSKPTMKEELEENLFI